MDDQVNEDELVPKQQVAEGLDVPDWLRQVREKTAARLFVGPPSAAYPSRDLLSLRADHAMAVDAVQTELELNRDFPPGFVETWRLFEVQSQAIDKRTFLQRPDFGRRLSTTAVQAIQESCPTGVDLQIVIGDGLSVAAVVTQVPRLLPSLTEQARQFGFSCGRPFVVRYCRVGILNDIGELLRPSIVVLLIGERPGLATAQSLSAYMAFEPRVGHTDAQRNLISNIHDRGVPPNDAVPRILALARLMRRAGCSGVMIKEQTAHLE